MLRGCWFFSSKILGQNPLRESTARYFPYLISFSLFFLNGCWTVRLQAIGHLGASLLLRELQKLRNPLSRTAAVKAFFSCIVSERSYSVSFFSFLHSGAATNSGKEWGRPIGRDTADDNARTARQEMINDDGHLMAKRKMSLQK